MRTPAANRILDAAEALLGRYGYRKMTIDDIAREAGMGKGTVYLSFRSKEDIVLSTVDRIVDRVVDAMEEAARADSPAPARLREMLLSRVTVRFDAVSSYSQGINDLLSSVRTGLLERRQRYFEREAELLGQVIAEGQSRGEIAEGEPLRLARSFILATNSFLPYALSPRELGDASTIRDEARDVIDLVVRAVETGRHSKMSKEDPT